MTASEHYPKHPIYVVSKGRSQYLLTSRSLAAMSIHHYIVVEPQDEQLYVQAARDRGIDDYITVLVAPFSNHGDGPGRARNWAWDHSIAIGAEYHWVLDDNIEAFYRFNKNKRIRCTSPAIFRAAEDFVERYENVPVSGFNYRFFVPPGDPRPAFLKNTRIYSCLLIRNDCKHRWRGRYNEDTDLSLRVLKDGDCTIQFNAFLQGKLATQTMKGGNTDEFYHAEGTLDKSQWRDGTLNPEGTLNKSQMLVNLHPDVTRLVWRYDRWHHHVDYSVFKNNKLKLKQDVVVSNNNNEYGMKLVCKNTK